MNEQTNEQTNERTNELINVYDILAQSLHRLLGGRQKVFM